MPLSLSSKLPAKEFNGIGVLLDETVAADGTVKPDAPTERYAVVRLKLDEHGVKGVETKAVWTIEHIESLPPGEQEDAARLLLAERLEERRANGQLAFDDDEPSIMRELLAEFTELADDLGVDVTAFKAEFAEQYGTPPEAAGEHHLREWIGLKRPRMTGRPVETVDAPVFSSETPEPVKA